MSRDQIELADWRCPHCGEHAEVFQPPPPPMPSWDRERVVPFTTGPPTIVCANGHDVVVVHRQVRVSTDRADDYGQHPVRLEDEVLGYYTVVDRDAVLGLAAFAEAQAFDAD